MAAPKSYKGWPMPSFFNEDAAELFEELELEESDVVMVSYVKAGTSWVNKIIHCILRMDKEGSMQKAVGADLGASGQIYPDWLPATLPSDPSWLGVGPEGMMGKVTFADLCAQPKPRLFSTHLPGTLLPKSLKQQGRLVYVLRNPKDCVNSLHYFRGEAEDGWEGNEHGPGSLERFMSGVNAYGGFWDHVLSLSAIIEGPCVGRALVVYYEDLKNDLPAGIRRIADFCGEEVSDAKLDAICKAITFDAMKGGAAGAKVSAMLCRNGVCGDWMNAPLGADQWQRIDSAFDEKLGSCTIAQPLRRWMNSETLVCHDGL